ncbi:MAG: glutamate--tRNA ligase [Candidatus Nanohaloarchaea archaeon]
MELEELARKYALQNAVEHDGECNTNAVMGQIFSEGEFEDKGKVGRAAGKVCAAINQMSLEEQKEEMEAYEYEEEEHEHDPIPDLDVDEDEEVVVRFAPNPNGPPHLGHARGMTINGELKEKYDGKLILRFDDTDPVTKRPMKEAYQMYEEDYEWLGYEPDEVRYSSKNFDKYIEYAEELIEKGKAYVSKASQEEMQKHRREGTASEYRDQSIEKNMELWEKMKNGGLEEGEAVLKVKTDLDHKNPAVRDFVAFRIIDDADHPITGDKYRVWPLLDFQGAIEDKLMGTTHIVRGKDLRASTKRQKFVYEYFEWDYPDIRYWGNVRISGFNAPVSSSTLGEMVEEGELDGWDDPRAPTIRALKRRGFRPEAIRNFFREMGVTENDVEASIEGLEKENTRLIDEESDRAFLVRDPVKIEINDVPADLKAEIPVHPDFPERGHREYDLEVGDGKVEIFVEESDLEDGFMRLKGLCNIEVEDGSVEYRPGDHKDALENDAEFIHWVPQGSEEVTVRMPDGEDFEGLVEPVDIEVDEVVQFERFGFARKDSSSVFYFTHG